MRGQKLNGCYLESAEVSVVLDSLGAESSLVVGALFLAL